jgi:methyl-accepting chemotaxis protein
MRMFRTITAKVTVLSLVAVAVCLCVGAVSLRVVSDLRHRQQVAVVIQHALHNQSEIDGANHAAQYDALVAATADAQTREATLEDLAERRDTLTGGIAENRDLLLPLGDSDGLAQAFDAIAAPLAAYDSALAAIADAMRAGNRATDEQVEAVDAGFEGFDVPFDALAEATNAYIADLDTHAADKAGEARTLVLTLLIAGGLLILVFGFLIRRAIAKNLNQTEQILTVVDAATGGDLTGAVTVHGDDPIGRVGDGLGRLLTDLRGSVGSIKQVAERLAISSSSLLTVSGDMATTATEASTQAESMSTSAGQLSDNVGVMSEGTAEMESAMHHIATTRRHGGGCRQQGSAGR